MSIISFEVKSKNEERKSPQIHVREGGEGGGWRKGNCD